MKKDAHWYLLTKAIDKHLIQLLLPLGISVVFLNLFLPRFKIIQVGLAVIFIYLYISFSLLHHKEDKSLTLEVTLEYILIATLTLVLLLEVTV